MVAYNKSFSDQKLFRRYTDGVLTDDNPFNTAQSWVDTRVGTSLPRWRQIIREGGNASTPYICTFSKVNKLNCSVQGNGYNFITRKKFEDSYRGRLNLGWGTSLPNPSGYSSAQADSVARGKFLAHYRERRTAFQGGVFLGELMETVQLIRRPAEALRQAVDRYRGSMRDRLRRRRYDKRLVQDSWLEFSFGVKPLWSDIQDACQLATLHPFRVFEPITGRSHIPIEGSDSVETQNFGLAYGNYAVRNRGFVEVKYKGAIGAGNDPPSFPEQLGFSWSNVLPTLWELIPYSFLVDYFSNVGKVIEGVSTGPIWLSWGCCITVKQYEQEIKCSGFDLTQVINAFGAAFKDINGFATGGGIAGSRTEFNRQPITSVSLGIGDLSFKVPGSATKWLNIAALGRMRTEDFNLFRGTV